MCGIVGILAFTEEGQASLSKIETAVQTLKKRGPDSDGIYQNNKLALGHARLSIIDTSSAANQPFTDDSGKYTIVFNGEIYNYQSIKRELLAENPHLKFKTQGDTEVLLYAYMYWQEKMLQKLNGFFTFAIYDAQKQLLLLARDRIGIKPLLIYQDAHKLLFASELKALLAFDLPKVLNHNAVFRYLQLNYIPTPNAIFEHVHKLMPGTYLKISLANEPNSTHLIESAKKYYQIPYKKEKYTSLSYAAAQKKCVDLLDAAVQKRLLADVPLGVFLSGGIDSSVLVALASRYRSQLNTFSIGFKDAAFFDETKYAQLVANKYKTNHTVFTLSTDELFDNLYQVLDYLDEPFADPSALPVYILSKHTRKHVTVALSGDGGDELLAGYTKHRAAYRARNGYLLNSLLKCGQPLLSRLPQSRNSKLGNFFRQLNRFVKGMSLSTKDRYWIWASILSEHEVGSYLQQPIDRAALAQQKEQILAAITETGDLNEELYTDMHLVLVGDMLAKVDSMSMANGLEVRTPFLDHTFVEFAFRLPVKYKIDSRLQKKILQDAFRPYLPAALYNRPKHGFDVPLLQWFRTELRPKITGYWLHPDFVAEQGVFQQKAIKQLLQRLFSNNPGDAAQTVWGLIVFQHWWDKYFLNK